MNNIIKPKRPTFSGYPFDSYYFAGFPFAGFPFGDDPTTEEFLATFLAAFLGG